MIPRLADIVYIPLRLILIHSTTLIARCDVQAIELQAVLPRLHYQEADSQTTRVYESCVLGIEAGCESFSGSFRIKSPNSDETVAHRFSSNSYKLIEMLRKSSFMLQT